MIQYKDSSALGTFSILNTKTNMQTRNKDSVTIRKEANEIREAARARLDEHIEQVKKSLEPGSHQQLENEILELLSRHKENGESLKGPAGLAAQAKSRAQHLSKMGNQKNILRFLKLHAAHDKLMERLKKEAADQAVAMAAKRVYDLLKAK